jgi:hypothetical protein
MIRREVLGKRSLSRKLIGASDVGEKKAGNAGV